MMPHDWLVPGTAEVLPLISAAGEQTVRRRL